ncbi:MAG: alanine racemase [Clostridia bacterium]|nr:alanine racemase [Clostridia bacterium]
MKGYVINTQAVKANVEVVRRKAGDRVVYGVVKSNGYGMGLVPFAETLIESGITLLAVYSYEEAVELRESGIEQEILVLCQPYNDETARLAVEYGLTVTVGSTEAAVLLNGMATEEKVTARVHLEIDTGMGRGGFLWRDTDKLFNLFRFMPALKVEGIYTHLAYAHKPKAKYTQLQLSRFDGVLACLKKENVVYGISHVANSQLLFRGGEDLYDAVRVGSALVGRVDGDFGLQRVGLLEGQITDLKWLPKGSCVGYGAGYRCRKNSKIAIINVGQADGVGIQRRPDLFRVRDVARYVWHDLLLLLRKKPVCCTVNGKKAQLVGRVSLSCAAADVSNVDCKVGDTVYFDVIPMFVNGVLPRIYTEGENK